MSEGIDAAMLDRVKAPAGLDLGAITPEEIAMSILAEITLERRRGQRG
jgi:xanthine dehydrogenase accessory factor